MPEPTAPETGLDCYIVGGFVRDRLLGLNPKDRDWVVVGATAEQMLERGFQQVGKDFPVFLHPVTHEEYALARTERKSGQGYTGFVCHTSPDITLEQDLQRRDLTVNAMAMRADGQLIDPWGGQQDLARRRLRHVSPAFSEDPLRVLRAARFAAQLDFDIADETLALCRQMVASGELNHLVPERVWQELQRALQSRAPRRFIEALRRCDALAVLFPEIDALFGIPQPQCYHPEIDTGDHVLRVLDQASQASNDPRMRFAALVHDLGKAATPRDKWPSHHSHEALGVPLVDALCERYHIPKAYHRLARKVTRYHLKVHTALELKPTTLLQLLKDVDAYRQVEDFELFLKCCEADAHGRKGLEQQPYPQADFLRTLRHQTAAISAADVDSSLRGPAIGQAIDQLRLERIQSLQASVKTKTKS